MAVVPFQKSAKQSRWAEELRYMKTCSRRGTRCLIRNQNIVNFGSPKPVELIKGDTTVETLLSMCDPDVSAGYKIREYLRCEVIPNLQGKPTNAKVGVNRKIFYKTDDAESFWQDLLPSDERLAERQEAAKVRNERLQEAIRIKTDFNGTQKEQHKMQTSFKKTNNDILKASILDGFAAPEKARGLLKIVKQQFDLSVDRRGNRIVVIFVKLHPSPPLTIPPPPLPELSHCAR